MQVNAKTELGFGWNLTLVDSRILFLDRTDFQSPVICVQNVNATKSLIVDVSDVGKGQNLKISLSYPRYLGINRNQDKSYSIKNIDLFLIIGDAYLVHQYTGMILSLN